MRGGSICLGKAAAVSERIHHGGGRERILFEDPVTSVEVPYTSLLTAAVIDGILARYPFLKSGEIGKSVMGKPISYLEIGNGEKEVFYNASFHGK